MKIKTKRPTSFWVIGAFALIWNIIELYLTTYQMDFLQENTTAEEFAVLQSVPLWYGITFVIALFSETLGVFMLLLKKKWAIKFFAVSLITLVLTELYWLFIIDINNSSFILSIVVPLVVIGVAVFLFLYSKRAAAKGWIK
ncbi:MAG: hypothetical protein KBT58_10750 [Bizionia sp.]|nr:hypothetical protein [Bizionia sp.]